MQSEKHEEATKLFKNIEKFSNTKTAESIVFGCQLSSCASKEQCAEWVNCISSKLEETFDESTIKKIRQGCYCGDGGKLDENKRWLKELYSESKSISEFVEKVNNHVKKIANQDAGW